MVGQDLAKVQVRVRFSLPAQEENTAILGGIFFVYLLCFCRLFCVY